MSASRISESMASAPATDGRHYRLWCSVVELRITVTVEPTERHVGQPLTRAEVDRVVALRERIEEAVAEVLEGPGERTS